jgi:hypothetical protein
MCARALLVDLATAGSLLAAAFPANAAAYTFTTFSALGAPSTDAGGINNAEQIVGAVGVSGYVRDAGGSFTIIDVPGASSTSAHGINNMGQVGGQFSGVGGQLHGFLDSGGSFTTIDPPVQPLPMPWALTTGDKLSVSNFP